MHIQTHSKAIAADLPALSAPLADHLNSLLLIQAKGLKSEITRLRILEAAKNTFFDKGYDAVSIDDIMRMAGLSRAGFYVYFSGKFAAAEALANYAGLFILKDLQTLSAIGPHPSKEMLIKWTQARFTMTASQSDYMQIFRHVAAADPRFPALTRQRYQAHFTALGLVYPAFAQAHVEPDGADALRAHLIFSRLDQICMDLIAGWAADKNTLAALFAEELHAFLAGGHHS